MRKLDIISLKVYLLLVFIFSKIQLWAQADDDEIGFSSQRGGSGLNDIDGMMDYQSIRFSIGDVIMVVLLLVACYVFGKIWKGCSYLLLITAAIFYYLLRF